ncbi:MAG: hypothetical protein Q8J78_09965 [Moraxellaceae bacterium]|nr:hypothetical protein [Moraxellaceae bacterium]
MDQTQSKPSRKNPSIKKDRALEARRRAAAQAALKTLKGNKTLSLSYRAIFASNLGSMYERCKKNESKLSLNKLFIDAFGKDAGPSAYKKRKTLIHLPSEELVAEGLCAKSAKYRDLALAMAKYLVTSDNVNPKDKQTAAIQRLIEGIDEDGRENHKSRLDREYREEINLRLNQLCSKVSREVDLDWMYSWTKNHPVLAVGPTGTLDEVGHAYSDAIQESDIRIGTLSVDGRVHNCLAPCVRIGTTRTRMYATRYMEIEIAETDPPAVSRIREKLSEILKIEAEEKNDDKGDIVSRLIDSHLWIEKDSDPVEYQIKRTLDLELRYDEQNDNWQPCFLLRSILNSQTLYDNMSDYIHDFWGEIVEVFTSDEHATVCLAKKVGENKYRLFFDDYFDSATYSNSDSELVPTQNSGSFRGLHPNNGITPSSTEFIDFLLSPSNDREQDKYQCDLDRHNERLGRPTWTFDSEIGSYRKFSFGNEDEPALSIGPDTLDAETHQYFCNAPTGSIAYEILANLAYAPEGKRLDTLLIKDAKQKYQILKAHSQTLEQSYLMAISRFS